MQPDAPAEVDVHVMTAAAAPGIHNAKAWAWQQVSSVRASTPTLLLLAAQRLPALVAQAWPQVLPCLLVPRLRAVLSLLPAAGHNPDLGLALAALLRECSGLLPDLPAPDDIEPVRDCLSAEDPHDAYFCICRVPEARASADCDQAHLAAAVVGSLIHAVSIFLDEALESEDLAVFSDIARAPLALALALAGSPLAGQDAPPVLRMPAGEPQMRAVDPVRRWLRGHQIFAALTQGLVLTMERFTSAHCRGDVTGLGSSLVLLGDLYHASALAFRFSADFDPEIYAHTIRPSMCEPFVPAGFSGTLSSDHGVLVRQLAAAGPAFEAAKARLPDSYARMRETLAQVYANHKWVCSRFDGAQTPSLRTSSHAGESSAVDMLERFRTRRLGMLP